MNWSIVLIEALIFVILFTCMVMIPTIKNPVSGIHNYPPEIQEEYFKTHERVETAPLSRRTLLIKSIALLAFAGILTGGAILAGADSFGDGFLFGIILFAVVGAYDTFFLDWVLFAKMKLFRLPGTEHMDKEYAQKWFHLKGMLFPGSLFAMIIGVLVGLAVMIIA
ncbi:MAG: hypothetical protein IJ833_07105 [Lachnospiraceae bacterium]|nr:hypothetical protein [Lachnospiraceae bacterium]